MNISGSERLDAIAMQTPVTLRRKHPVNISRAQQFPTDGSCRRKGALNSRDSDLQRRIRLSRKRLPRLNTEDDSGALAFKKELGGHRCEWILGPLFHQVVHNIVQVWLKTMDRHVLLNLFALIVDRRSGPGVHSAGVWCMAYGYKKKDGMFFYRVHREI